MEPYEFMEEVKYCLNIFFGKAVLARTGKPLDDLTQADFRKNRVFTSVGECTSDKKGKVTPNKYLQVIKLVPGYDFEFVWGVYSTPIFKEDKNFDLLMLSKDYPAFTRKESANFGIYIYNYKTQNPLKFLLVSDDMKSVSELRVFSYQERVGAKKLKSLKGTGLEGAIEPFVRHVSGLYLPK
ncbi:hypothetical protein JW711_02905 [Candidatus Woesearchaeota archaeon]|nr:hypothetical protein [Candidatus Woesearchaeota archaeon]